jgi:hypothetical protein
MLFTPCVFGAKNQPIELSSPPPDGLRGPDSAFVPVFQTVSLGTGGKIAFAAAHFHSFGVALAGPWNTWVNRLL